MKGTAAESRERLALNIGRTKRYLQDGLSTVEIASKLKLPESSVRRYVSMIREAEENEKKIYVRHRGRLIVEIVLLMKNDTRLNLINLTGNMNEDFLQQLPGI